jgi:hypothetical protein
MFQPESFINGFFNFPTSPVSLILKMPALFAGVPCQYFLVVSGAIFLT